VTAQTKSRLAQCRRELALYSRVLPSLDLKRRQLAAMMRRERHASAAIAARATAALERDAARLPMLASAGVPMAAWAALVQPEPEATACQHVLGIALPRPDALRWRPGPLGLALPPWADEVAAAVREQVALRHEVACRDERLRRLDAAHRRTLQRVNLFERVLVPRAQAEIRAIVIRLADLERTAIVRAKQSRAMMHRRPRET